MDAVRRRIHYNFEDDKTGYRPEAGTVPLYVERRAENGRSGTLRSLDGSVEIELTCAPESTSLATVREAGWYSRETGKVVLFDGFIGEMLIKYRAPSVTTSGAGSLGGIMFEAEATERDRPPGYRIPNLKGKSKYNRKKKVRVKNKHKR